jgi:hypothetical protein
MLELNTTNPKRERNVVAQQKKRRRHCIDAFSQNQGQKPRRIVEHLRVRIHTHKITTHNRTRLYSHMHSHFYAKKVIN